MTRTSSQAARPARRLFLGAGVIYALLMLLYRVIEAIAMRFPGYLADTQPVVAALTGSELLALVAVFEPYLMLPLVVFMVGAAAMRSQAVASVSLVALLPFLVYYGPLFAPRWGTPGVSAGGESRVLTVMTHNILANNRDMTPLVDKLLEQNADVLALQELLPATANRLAPRLSQVYPYRVVHSNQGLGLYSRHPIRDAELVLLAESSWAIRATVDTPAGPIVVFNAHPRNPRIRWRVWRGWVPYIADFDPGPRDRAVENLARRIAATAGHVIVLGDLNLNERTWAYRVLTSELVDAHRAAGWGFGFTFPEGPGDPAGSFPPLIRIDYVLHSPKLRTIEFRVVPPTGSDHRPVVARIAVPA